MFNVFGGAGHFNVAGASTTGHHLIISDGDPVDWRPYAGSTTASVQIQSSSSRGMLFAAKTAANQDLIFTDGVNISVGATLGTNRGTDVISITQGGDVGITGALHVDDEIAIRGSDSNNSYHLEFWDTGGEEWYVNYA